MSSQDEKYTTDMVEDKQFSTTAQLQEATRDAHALGQGISGYESLTTWETIKKFKVAALLAFAATFSAATDGYQIGINGNIIANNGFVKQFATQVDKNGVPTLSAPVLSAIGSIQSVGQIIGMTCMPFIADRFGRKPAMLSYWFILALSVVCESVAREWQVWFVAKLFSGIGVGSLQFCLQVYVSEIAPTRIRGTCLMLYNYWFAAGQLMATVALQVMHTHSPDNYKTPIYTQWSQIGLMLIIYLILPESPQWAASKGKDVVAKKALRRLNFGVEDYDEDLQYELLRMTIAHELEEAEKRGSVRWYNIFQGRDGFRTFVSCWPLICQQFLGLTIFFSYASYFFSIVGFEDPFKVTCIISGLTLASNLVVSATAEKIGRRRLHNYGALGMWICCTCVGILSVAPTSSAGNTLLIVFTCLWVPGFTAQAATAWGYVGETSSARLRPFTAGFGASFSCVIGVILSVLFPYMLNVNNWNWGIKTAWFFSVGGLPCLVVAFFLMPETAGRTTAELDELFEARVKPWKFSKTTTAVQRAIQAQKGETVVEA